MGWPLSRVHNYVTSHLFFFFTLLLFVCVISRRLVLPVLSGMHLPSLLDELFWMSCSLEVIQYHARKGSFMPHCTPDTSRGITFFLHMPLCWPASEEPWMLCIKQNSNFLVMQIIQCLLAVMPWAFPKQSKKPLHVWIVSWTY